MTIYKLKRLAIVLLVLFLILIIGFIYFYIRFGDPQEAAWLAVTIISTTGMDDASKLTDSDKIFSCILVILSIIFYGFLIAYISEILLSDQIRNYFGTKKMKDKISHLKDHYIICGYGRIGRSIAIGLKNEKKNFVVIENRHEQIEEIAEQEDLLYIEGDASHDESLNEAGIARAKGIFCALGDNATNLLIVLSARALNPKITIVTRISSQDLELRYLRAGANHCVSPQSWGSRSMLLTMLNPTISQMLMQFLDKTIEAGIFDEVQVRENSKVHGKTLGESGIRKESNINVIGIRKGSDNRMIINPKVNAIIENGDTLICLGSPEEYEKLRAHLDQ